ncbi:hypothetical protein [Curtobacterium sp. TXMA1]|uniref:hypothetical protein n=1 Tax=Curtobacterium sp. TXMA1 TaxID=2876939 RepID=UPI001CCF976C|nr:hypothetical protein [Curtobacterium sp. TXMA1]UBQ02569.1 hypothetical protein LCG91_16225 [Curtobacterium sp. TXMA1]
MTAELHPIPLSFRDSVPDHQRVFCHSGVFDGAALTVVYGVDLDEHRRRVRSAVSAVPDEYLLAAAMTLPDDDLAPVPPRFTAPLTGHEGHTVAAVVADPAGEVWGRRVLQPVVDVLEITAEADSWTRGCAVAHEWVGYGPRVVRVAEQGTADWSMLMTEASHYGIGIVCGLQDDRVLEPAPFRPRRWTAARWRFSELVYEQFLRLLPGGHLI